MPTGRGAATHRPTTRAARWCSTNFTNSGYTMQNTVAINGVATDQTFPMPEEPAGDVPLAVTCEGDTLTTKPDVSPFTTTWHR